MKIMVKTNSSVFQPNYFMQWSCVHNIWFPAASLHNLPWCSSCLYLPYCDINLRAVFKVCYQQWSMTASHKQFRRFARLFFFNLLVKRVISLTTWRKASLTQCCSLHSVVSIPYQHLTGNHMAYYLEAIVHNLWVRNSGSD